MSRTAGRYLLGQLHRLADGAGQASEPQATEKPVRRDCSGDPLPPEAVAL
jgi:hypothetical protein